MKVLVVDDREENRMILGAKLSAHGYASEMAVNGLDALAKLRRGSFDAVISDLLMPGMDGYQLTHAIKTDEDLQRLPVIIYTSTYTDPRDETLARNLGANGFILKPATDETFFGVLADTIARAGKGELPSGPITQDEVKYLKDYTARLIQKLEDKVEEAEVANEKLSALNASLEQKVRDATAELRETNAELEAYVNSVTHDLRAPLRTIEGMSTLLLENDPPLDPAERDDLLRRVARSAAHMQQLMQDLLDYSKLKQREIPVQTVDLHQAVTKAAELMGPEVAAAKAQVEIAPTMPKVRGFEPVLVQAVANLLSNAVKFVPAERVPHVRVTAEKRGDRVRLAVSDNGIGIPPHDRGRLFQVFERLHSQATYPGTGVGLAMVKRAVQKMGGELGVESEPGQGSTFWVDLPAAEEA
jgi:signal transduction histidine kinase